MHNNFISLTYNQQHVLAIMAAIIRLFTTIKKKVKCILAQALMLCTGCTAHTASRGIALPFHDDTRREWGVRVMPRPLFTPGKDPVTIAQEAGGPQGRSGQVRKISPAPGFDPRTVHPVASRYTNYTTRPTFDPRTVHPVASRYTNYTMRPTFDPRTVHPVASRYTHYTMRPT